jgi:CheY-like chemotaxis protein
MEATLHDIHILLIEDHPDIREILATVLETEGHCVVSTAEDGDQGLKLLYSFHRPSIVLLDLGLPIVDGYEFLRRQKADPGVADIPVVVITAEPEPSVPDAEIVFQKPVDVKQLMSFLVNWFAPRAQL